MCIRDRGYNRYAIISKVDMTMPKTVGTGCGVSGAPTEEMSLFQVCLLYTSKYTINKTEGIGFACSFLHYGAFNRIFRYFGNSL